MNKGVGSGKGKEGTERLKRVYQGPRPAAAYRNLNHLIVISLRINPDLEVGNSLTTTWIIPWHFFFN